VYCCSLLCLDPRGGVYTDVCGLHWMPNTFLHTLADTRGVAAVHMRTRLKTNSSASWPGPCVLHGPFRHRRSPAHGPASLSNTTHDTRQMGCGTASCAALNPRWSGLKTLILSQNSSARAEVTKTKTKQGKAAKKKRLRKKECPECHLWPEEHITRVGERSI